MDWILNNWLYVVSGGIGLLFGFAAGVHATATLLQGIVGWVGRVAALEARVEELARTTPRCPEGWGIGIFCHAERANLHISRMLSPLHVGWSWFDAARNGYRESDQTKPFPTAEAAAADAENTFSLRQRQTKAATMVKNVS